MTTRLILIGFGTVGQGLAELLLQRQERGPLDPEIRVVAIADLALGTVRDENGIDLAKALGRAGAGERLAESGSLFLGDPLELIDSTAAEMVVEATPTDLETGEPAASYIRSALAGRMHVTTTNKGPIALFLHELRRLASAHRVELLFEGTVMSGTPVLNLHRETLSWAGVSKIRGILNGTTNFILCRMEEGLEYAEALREAQRLGYAETEPDADVRGLDALAKVTILAKEVFDARCRPADFPCTGIEGVDRRAVAAAVARGKRIKLIGTVRRDGERVTASVEPEEVDLDHPLASIAGPTNALTFTTEALGDVTVIGPGAGRRETGYSCLADILRIGVRR